MVVYVQAYRVNALVGDPDPVEPRGVDDEEVVAWGTLPQGLIRQEPPEVVGNVFTVAEDSFDAQRAYQAHEGGGALPIASPSKPLWVVTAALSRFFKRSTIWRVVLFIVLVCISPPFFVLGGNVIDYFVYYLNRESTQGTLSGRFVGVKLAVRWGNGRRGRLE